MAYCLSSRCCYVICVIVICHLGINFVSSRHMPSWRSSLFWRFLSLLIKMELEGLHLIYFASYMHSTRILWQQKTAQKTSLLALILTPLGCHADNGSELTPADLALANFAHKRKI